MRLAVYAMSTMRRGAVIERSFYPGECARASARSHFAHPMSDEAISHFARQPRPTFDEKTDAVTACARAYTLADVRTKH